MGYSSRGYPPPKSYLFIDGAYFRKYLEYLSTKYYIGKQIVFNYEKLKVGYEKVFYYDCLPAKKSKESKDDYEQRIKIQKDFFNQLKMIDGFHVYEGSMSGTDGKARQKQVDIMIAVHMLSHSIRGNMDRATLLAGDLDFKPLVDALIQEGMYVTLWYDSRSASKELIYSADARQVLIIDYVCKNSNIGQSNNYKIPVRIYEVTKSYFENTKILKYGYSDNVKNVCLRYHKIGKEYIVTFERNDSNKLQCYHYTDLSHLEDYLRDISIHINWYDVATKSVFNCKINETK